MRDENPRRLAADLEALVAAFLAGPDGPRLENLAVLEGEELALELAHLHEGGLQAVTFLSDGIRQVAPSGHFDPVACARAIADAVRQERSARPRKEDDQ